MKTFLSIINLSFSVIGPGYLCGSNVRKQTGFFPIINYFIVPGLCLQSECGEERQSANHSPKYG